MSSFKTLLTLREWKTLGIGPDGLGAFEANRFQALAERAAKSLGLPRTGVLARTLEGLRAGQVVGVLSSRGRTLELLPKIDGSDETVRHACIRMLAAAYDLRLSAGELANMRTQRHDLLELLIRLFAERLLAAVRHGLARRYTVCEADLPTLRGRLDVVQQFTRLAVRPDRLACRFEEFSPDTPLNRVLKATVLRLATLARSAANVRLLTALATYFDFVGDSPHPLEERVRLDRTDTAFHDLYRYARLLLAGDWQSSAAGPAEGFTLVFPMNDLFEKFVGRCLQRALAPRPVKLQHRGHHALADEDGTPLFALRPDAVVDLPSENIVLDTKWKVLVPTRGDLNVAAGDVYQMQVYARTYKANRAVLLYPWHAEMGRCGIARRWQVAGDTGHRLDIATVNVGCPETVVDTLRGIVGVSSPNC